MSKQNSAECQFAIKMFKATEMSMKKLLDLLEKTVEQERSFRSLSLMINKIKGLEAELKKLSEEVMRQQPHQSTASSILNRQTTLITRLNELELQIDLLDDDGQLSQSSSRIRDDVSMISSRRNLSQQSTPAPSDDQGTNPASARYRRKADQQQLHQSAAPNTTTAKTTIIVSTNI